MSPLGSSLVERYPSGSESNLSRLDLDYHIPMTCASKSVRVVAPHDWCRTMYAPCYTWLTVPTTRPRIVVTETDELREILDRAAERWPEDRHARRRLLLHLVEAGDQAAEAEREALIERRRAVIAENRANPLGEYDPNYLEELRRDWPD